MPIDIQAQIPTYVRDILDVLHRNGKQGYLVGGSLRDLLRGVEPHDFDLTTNATPDEMLDIFKNFRVIPTGLAHGTLTVLSNGDPVEITTHRTDGTYTDSRHPDSVSFTTDLAEDLARRDFTVNAMAWSAQTGLVDLFGGQRDLSLGLLRAVGDPVKRFSEDALRILRCFRFAAQLDFTVEAETAKGAAACAARLCDIAVERIFAELERTVIGVAAARGLSQMRDAGCLPFVFFDSMPDLSHLNRLSDLPAQAPLRMAALLHHETPEALAALAKRWHASNAFLSSVCAYVGALGEKTPETPYEARRFVCRHFPYFEGALQLRAVLLGEDTAPALSLSRAVLKDGTAVELRRLAVNGKELQNAVSVRPEKTAALLTRLQDLVWQEPKANRRDTLLAHARRICEKENWL